MTVIIGIGRTPAGRNQRAGRVPTDREVR